MAMLAFQSWLVHYSEILSRRLMGNVTEQFFLSSQNKYSDLEGSPVVKICFPTTQPITSRPASKQVKIFFVLFPFLFFFWPHLKHMEVPGPRSNLSHSWDLCHSFDNARSLTNCTTAGNPQVRVFMQLLCSCF